MAGAVYFLKCFCSSTYFSKIKEEKYKKFSEAAVHHTRDAHIIGSPAQIAVRKGHPHYKMAASPSSRVPPR
jgi:hypothetical protein